MEAIVSGVVNSHLFSDAVTATMFGLIGLNVVMPYLAVRSYQQLVVIGRRYHHAYDLETVRRYHTKVIVLSLLFFCFEFLLLTSL